MIDYRSIINAFAFGVLYQNPDIPDYRLMVGTAEDLTPQPVLTEQAQIPKEIATQLHKYEDMDDEQTYNAIANGILEVNDYNGNTAILAGKIGGVA